MHGTMLVIEPTGGMKRTDFDRKPPEEEFLQTIKAGIGGGYLEKVPGFTSIRVETDIFDCVALCDEDGKRKELPLNREATARWQAALKATGHPGLIEAKTGRVVDFLVGPVVVLIGDDEFMESL